MQLLTIIVVVILALALVGLVFWLSRRFAGDEMATNSQRGRAPRLAVIDATPIDNHNRRRLVLVRRDNVEHLLMIGGPTDIVVETNIVRATPARDQSPQRTGAELPRIGPLHEPGAGWADEGAGTEPLELPEPQLPEPPVSLPRPARPSFAEETRRQAPAIPERELRTEPMSRIARLEPMMSRPQRHSEPSKVPPVRAPEQRAAATTPPPPPPSPAPPQPQPTSNADQNIADMAQRLEAALRRPAADAVAPPVAPEPPTVPSPLDDEREPAAPAKSGFESLEEEMASLLGRPKPSS